ncbi:ABC transporter permease [Pelovirga terrestris]|uniref:Transport permease protein n=1 Tax=Pelovirga terrestris TaxID=2771352 RepID=A0A8J6QY07_9BACT|nr:ABC transporter permease [Pelovirga terrestris]MBD1401316.1 ABC transporter permease [Pelovirga terrestris]
MQLHSPSPFILFKNLRLHRQLLWQMTKREVVGRYRGSMLGLFWSFFNPVFMLMIYTFVFSVVFQAKWGESDSGSKVEFAVILFAGLIVFNLFSEVINRSPGLILSHVNYVKKVVFPLEILPVVVLGSALFHALVSLLVLLLFNVLVNQSFAWTIFLLPIVVFPLLVFILGCSWFLASVGVFLRDVSQTITILTTALLFLSPIFFPLSALPESFRPYLFLNPLALIIEQARGVLLWGHLPHWSALLVYLAFSTGVFCLGLLWFQKTRKGFADVL